MREPQREVTRLGTGSVLVGVRLRVGQPPREVEDRVRRWLAPAGNWHVHGQWQDGVGLLALTEDDAPVDLDVVCWGRPFDGGEPVPAAELRAALADPAQTAAWSGWFVVAGWTRDGLRLVTSTELTATLRTVDGPAGEAVATRGGAALAAAGSTAEVVAAHVAEFVVLDYVLGDDELLRGVRVLPPGSTVTVDRGHLAATTHTDPASWLRTDGPATATADLHDALRRSLVGLGAGDARALLALTAGRDSRLVARVLSDLGAAPRTFTIGGGPDAVGAGRLARSLGWQHEVLLPAPAVGIDWDRGVAACRWTDGLETVWNSVGPGLDGPITHAEPWDLVSGSGGEIGRGFYWATRDGEVEPAQAVLDGVEPELGTGTVEQVRQRLADATARLPGAPSDPHDVLDLLYAYGRMRKWLGHSRTTVPVRSLTAAYTQRPVVAALLRLPEEAKRTGGVFDELTATLPPVRTAPPLHQRVRRFTRRGRARREDAPDPVVALAARHLPGGFVEEVLGLDAVAALGAAAPGPARRRTWNALTVEALAQSL